MFKKAIKKCALSALILLGGSFPLLATDVAHISAEESASSVYRSIGGAEYEEGTFKMSLTVGESGQIRRPQTSPFKDFNYSFEIYVEDPSVISFDEQGNWVAHKAGTTKIIPSFPANDQSEQYRKFSEELKANPVSYEVAEVAVVWEVTVTDSSQKVDVYRLYNPALKVHLYTKDTNEYKVLATRGWKQEGVVWQSHVTEGEAVYRLYHSGLKVHLYTRDANEYAVLASRGWKQEGVAYRSKGDKEIYRLYHKGIKKHLYTTSTHERDVLSTRGWRYEGVAWYGQ